MKEENICETCGSEAFAGVCQKCQEVVSCCDCPRLARGEDMKQETDWEKGFNKKFQHFGECRRTDIISFIRSQRQQVREEVVRKIIKWIKKGPIYSKDGDTERIDKFILIDQLTSLTQKGKEEV